MWGFIVIGTAVVFLASWQSIKSSPKCWKSSSPCSTNLVHFHLNFSLLFSLILIKPRKKQSKHFKAPTLASPQMKCKYEYTYLHFTNLFVETRTWCWTWVFFFPRFKLWFLKCGCVKVTLTDLLRPCSVFIVHYWLKLVFATPFF